MALLKDYCAMENSSGYAVSPKFWLLFPALFVIYAVFSVQGFHAAGGELAASATYAHGILNVTLPYHSPHAGSGKLMLEILNPEDETIGRTDRGIEVAEGNGIWREQIKVAKSLAVDELVWHRVRYRFEYSDGKAARIEGVESISQILRTPVVRILGQQSYLAGGQAAVRVIVTDSQNQVISGRGSVQIELLIPDRKNRLLFSGRLNHRGTTEAQFVFPSSLVGSYQLRYLVNTSIGSTEFTQTVRLEDKVSILLTTEKPIYQPGQTIHVRALALDRANHEATANRKLTFEVEDSRGNKVFKKATQTDEFGIASAEFGLADEVNLGTYHLRALVGEGDAPANTAELALNVQRYVLPKFKVAVDFADKDHKTKRGYRPGDHVTGTVHANYFFGKPVDDGEITVKASSMDVSVSVVASVQGRTDHDGSFHFDLRLPAYFAGRPLSQGVARVLVEATVKDSADHSETRGQPITVSESPLLITAVPEGGTLVPNLENQVFILTSYPDGTPASAKLKIHAKGAPEQVTSDDGGVAVVRINATAGSDSLKIEAEDQEGNQASSTVQLQAREGEDQILLRTERAVYRAGERIELRVFSTRKRGTAYVDIVKEGQTVLTRDLDLEDGHAEISLTATPDLAGTVDLNAYLFGRDARPVGDHRLVFVQPADELKIETVADAAVYKPGGEARVRFRVTNSRGEGVSAALGLQVVDEAVFALAEKQPGFAKVFFYLEQEVMKPRYEIHSIGMPEIVEPVEDAKVEQRDRAARALFSATEMVNTNKFETEVGRAVPMTKYPEYAGRYQARFLAQVKRLAENLSRVYQQRSGKSNLTDIFAGDKKTGEPDLFDAWGTELRLEPTAWYRDKKHYIVHSAGADRTFNTGDDMVAYLEVVGTRRIIGSPTVGNFEGSIDLNIEHHRGPFNGLAEITGTVTDRSGALIPDATVEVREVATGNKRTVKSHAAGEFSLPGLHAGNYKVEVVVAGFRTISRDFSLRARDRAVLAVVLNVGASTETIEVSGQAVVVETGAAGIVGGIGFGRGQTAKAFGGPVHGDAIDFAVAAPAPVVPAQNSAVLLKDQKQESASPAAHVRSYFPEALYINPEIITDQNGAASITIPIADSITTWRMAMLASSTHGALGSATSSLKVFQDFFVDLDLPVTLTQGDRVSIPVAVYNYSGTRGDVRLQLQSDDWFSLVDDTPEKSVEVDSSRVGGSQFTLEAKRIGKFKLTLSARMNGEAGRADIVVREIEVIPNGREQNLVFNGRLENTVRHELRFPAAAIPDASKILVRLYPGPLSQVIEGMDSILRMPGGCFEQTSSSTYPNVLALDYMKRTKKLTPEVHAKAEGYIANGYQRLLTFEVSGGGFSWFGQAPANKILTAYGLMEFSDMSRVYDVDPNLILRTQQWLASQQQADGSWKPDTSFINEGATNRYNKDVLRITAYLAWSLENTGYQGPAVEKAKQFIEKNMNAKMDAYTLAVVANFAVEYSTADRGKDRSFIREAMQLLLDARTEKDEQVWWNTEETGVYATGASAAVETTGLAVQALLKWGEASGTARKAMSYIASKKDAAGTWGTTQATIMALRALLLATEKGAADVQGTLEVLLNGKPVEKLSLTPENNDLLHQFVFKRIESKGKDSNTTNTVEIRFEGKGGLAYQIVGSYFLPWDEKPANEALTINVAYDRTHLAQDDIATATANVTNNLPKAANMVMVDLGIPPGFELLSEDLQTYVEKSAGHKSGRLEKFSLTATQAILYFNSIAPSETVTLHFRMRAKYPIRAKTFSSRVYEYYDPEVSSVARPVQLEVRQR
jgi:uncharacterized protein YfaS (alpha-2-macroglobulin family)